MSRKKSYLAERIDRDYKRQQFYKSREREKCKEKDCMKCKFFDICTESERSDD